MIGSIRPTARIAATAANCRFSPDETFMREQRRPHDCLYEKLLQRSVPTSSDRDVGSK